MKVTKLSSQKKDPSRVNMYIDEEFFCGISLNSVAKYSIYVGLELDEKNLNEIVTNELRNRVLDRSMGYISRSIRSEYQIRRYIRELFLKKKDVWYKDIPKEEKFDIEEYVIKKLKKYGYINDNTYAEQFVLSRIRNKPRGRGILISELISKGISKNIAEEEVNRLVEDEYSLLRKVYFKKYKDQKIDIRDNKKISFLLRKGFSWDLIESFINNEFKK